MLINKTNNNPLSYNFRKTYLAVFSTIFSASIYAEDLDILMAMSLEDLSAVEVTVTSAAKKEQPLSDVPAAIYVISNEQIRRSGARSIAEALALAPGIQVTKISEFNWQVSLRGLNEVLFNKLLVMIDGRSVFSPLMSGTFWHTIDTVLEDIDRIEVVRGSAGTMWGGNAANGVINIITKSSQDTLGSYFEVSTGDNHYQEVNYRYGLELSDTTTARVFAKGVRSDYYIEKDDPWKNYRAGIRADYQNSNNQVTFQAGGYHNHSEHNWITLDFLRSPGEVHLEQNRLKDYSRGAYISLDWIQHHHDTDYELHMWADTNSKEEPSSAGEFYSFDVDSLARVKLNNNHELTAGGGIRLIHRHTAAYPDTLYTEMPFWGRYSRDHNGTDIIYNAYLQLESSLSDNLTSVLGAKVEHFTQNNTTEFQPQARVLYTYSSEQHFWAGAGRAVVTPSIVDSMTDHYFFTTVVAPVADNQAGYFPGLIFTNGNEDLDNESVVTLDIGHRYSPDPALFIDSTVFYSRYKHLRMLDDPEWHCTYGYCEDGSLLPAYLFIQSSEYSDRLSADSYGFEMAANWMPSKALRINTSYSYIHTKADCNGSPSCEDDATGGYPVLYNHQPQHLVSVQALWDITPAWQLDLWFKHKSAVSSDITFIDGSRPYRAPSVSTVDIRLAWQQKPNWPKVEFIVDAIGKGRYEDLTGKAKVEETAFLRASWNMI